MSKRFFIFGLLLLLIASVGLYFLFHQDFTSGPKISATAPEFSLPDREGKKVELQSFRGKFGCGLAALGDVTRGQNGHEAGTRQLPDDLKPDAAIGARHQRDACFGH